MSHVVQTNKKFRMYTLFAIAFLFMASFFATNVSMENSAYAAWYGRGDRQGYFDNYNEGGFVPEYSKCGSLAPVLPNNCYGNNAIPAMSNTNDYYNWLRNRYNSTDNSGYLTAAKAQKWNKTGVAFIVNAMLGRTGNNGQRDISTNDWNALKARLDFISAKGSVDFHANVSISDYGYLNTFYQNTRNDVSNLTQKAQETSPGITFNYGGRVVFVLYYKCANPLGDLPGLPEPPSYNYNLTPVTTASPTIAESGDSSSFYSTVTNSGSTTSDDVAWQAVTFTVSPTGTVKSTSTGSQTPTAYYGNGASVYSSGTANFPKNVSSRYGQGSKIIPDLAVGSQICYAFAVRPYSQTTTDWRYGKPDCIKIGKEPKTQILGGDLRVGAAYTGSTALTSKITTSVAIKGTKQYGSYAEYGLAASGAIVGAASGSAYANGLDCTASCSTTALTFANSGTGTPGKFAPKTAIPDISASFPTTTTTPTLGATVNLSDVFTTYNTVKTVVVKAPAAIAITGGSVPKGRSLVINAPTSVVTIRGNIAYTTDPLSSVADIPQVVIVAKQINITDNVTNIDAWLVAKGSPGSINTCAATGGSATSNGTTLAVGTKISASTCNAVLTINGPVMANKLYLRRTGGSGTGAAHSGDPAEVINLRPDAYLWGSYQAQSGARLDTVSTQELPPRF